MNKQMIKYLGFFLFLGFLGFQAKAEDLQVYFSPSSKCENSIVKLINQSEESISAAVYAINNDAIVEALKKAHDRNVNIRILTDRLQASNRSSKVRELYDYGINIRVHSKFKIEHNKFAVYDEKIASSGSYNWTNPASDKNSENCIFFIKNKNAVRRYQSRFEYLWRINTKKKSDQWFGRKQS